VVGDGGAVATAGVLEAVEEDFFCLVEDVVDLGARGDVEMGGALEEVIRHAKGSVEVAFDFDFLVNEGFAECDLVGVMEQGIERGESLKA
jgi:hypothetical protein